MAMSTPKNEVKKILEQVPDDASFEDIQYHIYVCQKIKRGLKDIDEGRLLTQKEIERRMSRWLAGRPLAGEIRKEGAGSA